MQGKIVGYLMALLLLISLTACKNKTQLHGYSNLFPNEKINRVVVLPFQPESNIATQATSFTEYFLENNAVIKVTKNSEVLKQFDKDRLDMTNLSEKLINSICKTYNAQLIVYGEAVLNEEYSSFNKEYKYSHDVTIKLLSPKSGAVVGEYNHQKQTGKLETTIEQLVDKMINDMHWSPLGEMDNDVFDNDENNNAIP